MKYCIKILKNISNIIIKNLRWIIFLVSTIVFIKIIENIFENDIILFDSIIYNNISGWISNNITTIMKIITNLGSAICLLVICFILLKHQKTRKYGKYVTINLALIAVLNQVLKAIFQRPRPEEYRLIEENGYSFPSGHSMVSMAFYGLIIYLIYKKVKNPYIKWSSIICLFILVVAIGTSRVYLGVHYASDVIGGFCFSIAYLCLYTHIIKNNNAYKS